MVSHMHPPRRSATRAELKFRAALARELGRFFRSPYEAPVVVVFNAALVCIGWFLLPASTRNWLFSLHGHLAFPVVLASWMLADVPATNVAGTDPHRALDTLPSDADFRQFLAVKRFAFWLLVAPICAAIEVGIGIADRTYVSGISAAVILLVMPFGVLAISAWLGLRFPYHPRSLRWRWQHRRDRRTTVRWLVLVLVPYSFVPAIATVLLLPSIVVARVQARHGHGHTFVTQAGRLTGRGFAIGAVVACLMAAVGVLIGRAIATRIAARRREKLAAYLADPERG